MIGTTILHYRIRERLGQGGMGEVFLAEDLLLHRPVALKLLRSLPGGAAEERARLLLEARAASALNHPNIAVIYNVEDAETPDGRVSLLAMEYVPGKTLGELGAEASLALDDILDLMAQAADGLAEAHAHGVVHRDLKPSNLMVAQGRVKILDFGLAAMEPRAITDISTLSHERELYTPSSEFAGTPCYMSPEQALGRSLDARSDIFSLGVVFYELLARHRPFTGDNLLQTVDAIVHREPPPLPPRFSDARMPDIERLVGRMLAKDAAARPSDLRAVRDELKRLRSGALLTSAPAGALTMAVAGFANITRHAEDAWLGAGLTETVTAALQDVEGIEVWGPERLRDSLELIDPDAGELKPEDAVRLGALTGARWVLTGGFQRLADLVRVTARIVDVETGNVLRAAKADGRLDSIFELQDSLVAEIRTGLRQSVAAVHEGDDTQNVAAYEALAKGLLNMRADSYEALDRAILCFERAVALDPNYIRAQVELGAAYEQKGEYLAAAEYLERAIGIFWRVIEVRPRLPRAWRELGVAQLTRGHVEEALDSLRRAHALAPDDARVLAGLARGHFIGKADFETAAKLYAEAVARNPQAGWYFMQLAHCAALRRDFALGEAAARRAIELQEVFLSGQQGVQLVGAYMRRGHLLNLQGQFRPAGEALSSELAYIERLDHALRSRIRIELHMRLGQAFLGQGEIERAHAAFAAGLEAFTARLALGADEPFTRYYAGAIHALRGENDEALVHLERAVAGSPAFARARARIEPEWDGLRGDPRFEFLIGAAAIG